MRLDKTIDEIKHGQGSASLEAKHNDAGMGSGRILLKVADALVEGQKDSPLARRLRNDSPIVLRRKALFGDRMDVMPLRGQPTLELVRKIVIELELHQAVVASATCSRTKRPA